MDVKICDKCGRLFQSQFGGNTCPKCENTFDDDYHRVKDYLYDHPGATEREVREIFPTVTHKDIMGWLRSGRLDIADGSLVKLTCEKCGKVIQGGYLCDECQKIQDRIDARNGMKPERQSHIQKGVAVTPADAHEDSRMRFLDHHGKNDD